MSTVLRIPNLLLAAVVVLMLANGCVVKDISRTVEQTIKGDYYLKSKQFDKGQESFRQEIQENPDSALANYYYGRFLLQDNQATQALGYLKKASDLEPGDADYHFWKGLAYAELGDYKQEEKSYRSALSINKKHLQSLIYLGHNRLAKKHYTEALQIYSRALAVWSGSPSSLYNRALILQKLGRTPEEKLAWHAYLALYPSGSMARLATEHLNKLGDFSYRNHHLGARTVTTEKIWFEPFSSTLSSASRESLNLIGAIAENLPKGTLQIVFYQKNNVELARTRAVAIKRYFMDEYSIDPRRIGISWFAEPQVLKVQGKKVRNDESASFFITTDR